MGANSLVIIVTFLYSLVYLFFCFPPEIRLHLRLHLYIHRTLQGFVFLFYKGQISFVWLVAVCLPRVLGGSLRRRRSLAAL